MSLHESATGDAASPPDFADWSRRVGELNAAVVRLAPAAETIGVDRPTSDEWYRLLVGKLLPQLDQEPALVVAIVGGTNIGKSVIFNQLVGEAASHSTPMAAGTRHPVCVAPPDLANEEYLAPVFEDFELRAWKSSEDALSGAEEHFLFWRVGGHVPERLIMLDTPDIDSDVEINWQRADRIRHASDVLVAVLTQQKYNDAAVKKFFRHAAEADKTICVVVNQCDLVEDRAFWDEWLTTFSSETGANPELVYLVPYDRAAARDLKLPFYAHGSGMDHAVSPRDDLATLHFDEIKIRSFRGAMARVLDPQQGAPAYLRRIADAAAEFEAASRVLSRAELARVEWPTLPPALLVDEIRAWWDQRRPPWARSIHRFYRAVGKTAVWPVKRVWSSVTSSDTDATTSFLMRERGAVILAVERLFDELQRLSEVGSDTLRPRLQKLLRGESRSELITRVEEAHAALPPVDDDFRVFLREQLDTWTEANPRAVRLVSSVDQMLAIARPAVTVSLAAGGWIVAQGLVGEAAVQVATHTATEIATETAIAGGVAGGGELIVGTTAESVPHAAARLLYQLQQRYAQQRAAWLSSWLEQTLLGNLLEELRAGAELPTSEEYRRAESVLDDLARHA